jgi:hypothetical protein
MAFRNQFSFLLALRNDNPFRRRIKTLFWNMTRRSVSDVNGLEIEVRYLDM